MSLGISRRQALAGLAGLAAGAGALDRLADSARAACCYFAAKDKDVLQPAQKAFITWDPDAKREAFTVQPKFEGNASDFGMVIPTPGQPKLDEMPRDFFKELAVFTILEPMPLEKYKNVLLGARYKGKAETKSGAASVRVLEEGVVGSLDYKIIVADDARGLYDWLDAHKYSYGGDEATLDFYISKGWFFTVMKIDPKQMKARADGSFEGNITPTRFTFAAEKLIYPLRITRLSVKNFTEALFYVQAPFKVDLPGAFSYQPTWQPMWSQAMSFAVSRSPTEEAWLKHITPHLEALQKQADRVEGDGLQPATLEWAKKIGPKDIGVLAGTEKYNRDAPAEDVAALKILRGHVKEGQIITKFRKFFHEREMQDDLLLTRAEAGGAEDNTAYYEILPTSPP